MRCQRYKHHDRGTFFLIQRMRTSRKGTKPTAVFVDSGDADRAVARPHSYLLIWFFSGIDVIVPSLETGKLRLSEVK